MMMMKKTPFDYKDQGPQTILKCMLLEPHHDVDKDIMHNKNNKRNGMIKNKTKD